MDKTSPLWNSRLLPHELGAPADKRTLEVFHLRVLQILAPELVNLPFFKDQPVSGWPVLQSVVRRRIERSLRFGRKVVGELRRRGPHLPRPLTQPDSLASVLTLVRERAFSQREHAAWEVLDARQVERLLTSDPRSFGVARRHQVWRLATVFLAPEPVGEY